MRILFFLLLLLNALVGTSQTFNFTVDWFDNESFFNVEFLQEKKVKSIRISVSEKKDGAYFQQARPILLYEYNGKGLLNKSYKFIPLRNTMDTARFLFFYQANNQLYKRVEQQGLFNFGYYYFYQNNYLEKEVKIDQNSKDTAYLRYYESITQGLEQRTILLNSIRKPFATVTEKRSKNGLLLRKKVAYNRNPNYSETQYTYKENQLIQKKELSKQGKQQVDTYYSRKNGLLDLVRIEKNNLLIKKYAFTYSENGLPKEIIERDMIEKVVKIYAITYTYGNN